MQPGNRPALVGLALFGLIVLLGSLALFARDRAPELPVYWEAPAFALVDQTGDTLRSAELEGSLWVASFVFTNCKGVCPLISARMAGLRDTLAAERLLGSEVRLVSITVDPARDTPGVLREYAEGFGGSPPEAWAFLTGSPPDAVRRMIQEGFRLGAVMLPPEPGDTTANYQVEHSPRLLLVDRRGRVRGTYNATEPDAIDRVRADLRRLLD